MALFLVAVAACSCRGTGVPVREMYALQSIAGESLPAAESEYNICGHAVVADTLVLYEDGTGVRRTSKDVSSYSGAVDPLTCEPAASSPRTRMQVRSEFTYQIEGGAIAIDFVCPDFASCIAGPHLVGRFDSNQLVIETSRVGRVPLVYAQLPAHGLTGS